MGNKIEERVKKYWTQRDHDFGTVRKNELSNEMGEKWFSEMSGFFPQHEGLDILDVGTGTGFFAILLIKKGHRVTGIDFIPAMLEEAKELSEQMKLDVKFELMDAQNLQYLDHSFDVVISRNLTWTLLDPELAYREWGRVLRPNGVLLNFDACYARCVESHSVQNNQVANDSPYGHMGMTKELQKENDVEKNNLFLKCDEMQKGSIQAFYG